MGFIYTDPICYCIVILGPQSLSFTAFSAPSYGVFVFVRLEGETHRRIVDDRLVAVGAECFLFPWGLVSTALVAAGAFAVVAPAPPAAAVATTTLGECCVFCSVP